MRTRDDVLKEFAIAPGSIIGAMPGVCAMADRIAALEARAETGVTEAMVERAREAYRNAWWVEDGNADGNPFTMDARNRIWRAALEAAFNGGARDGE